MDQETGRVEDKVLNRRSTLKALFGLAAVAVGATAILMPAAAEAAPLAPPVPEPKSPAEPEIAKDSELPAAEPTQYYYRRRVYRRRVYYRPRRRVYYRPRRVYYRRRYIRRVYY